MTITCLSCSHYRTMGCLHGLPTWPTASMARCPAGQYEPGADEAEDHDQPNKGTNDE